MPNDNRIRLDPTPIDFEGMVGTSGQDHDNYPAPNTQARFDHLRMFLIGLLSCQSSDSEPSQYRSGTWWFDTKSNTMKIYSENAWVEASKVIKLGVTIDGNPITLQDWYDSISGVVQSLQSDVYFQSSIVTQGISLIPIPGTLQTQIIPGSVAFVFVNGIQINPLSTRLEPGATPTAVKVPTGLNIGDKVSVTIKFIPNQKFHSTEQVV